MNAKEQAVSSDQVKRVERFNCTNGGARYCYGCYQMTPDNEYGDYVSYDDYAALLQQLATEEARVRELERDAARYRFIREALYRDNIELGEARLILKVIGVCEQHHFDVGIDSAMASEGGG